METNVVLRPLVRLAKHELAFTRRTGNLVANTQRSLSNSQHPYTYTDTFDFLLPSSTINKHHAYTKSHRHGPLLQSCPACPGHPLQRRMFSVFPAARAAVVTANPRKDEDGNEMLIDITSRASKVFSLCFLATLMPDDC